MDSSRLWRLAVACRPLCECVVLTASLATQASAADAITGIVVDQAGHPLPRAFVRTLDTSGKEFASTWCAYGCATGGARAGSRYR
jgi:hypothetical protein